MLLACLLAGLAGLVNNLQVTVGPTSWTFGVAEAVDARDEDTDAGHP